MKIKRTDKDFGGGSGRHILDSSLFYVVLWANKKGKSTTLEIKPCNIEINFEGWHRLKSDKACFNQLSVTEIKKIILSCEKAAFERGRSDKAVEIRKCLNIY